MNDKELLVAAARAAGIDVKYAPGGNADGADVLRIVYKRDGYHDWLDREWNPLTDDGDALRLAVKLEMLVDFMQLRVVAGQFAPEVFVDFEDGEYRRAIVRAAAEIGSRHNAAAVPPKVGHERLVLPKQTTGEMK